MNAPGLVRFRRNVRSSWSWDRHALNRFCLSPSSLTTAASTPYLSPPSLLLLRLLPEHSVSLFRRCVSVTVHYLIVCPFQAACPALVAPFRTSFSLFCLGLYPADNRRSRASTPTPSTHDDTIPHRASGDTFRTCLVAFPVHCIAQLSIPFAQAQLASNYRLAPSSRTVHDKRIFAALNRCSRNTSERFLRLYHR